MAITWEEGERVDPEMARALLWNIAKRVEEDGGVPPRPEDIPMRPRANAVYFQVMSKHLDEISLRKKKDYHKELMAACIASSRPWSDLIEVLPEFEQKKLSEEQWKKEAEELMEQRIAEKKDRAETNRLAQLAKRGKQKTKWTQATHGHLVQPKEEKIASLADLQLAEEEESQRGRRKGKFIKEAKKKKELSRGEVQYDKRFQKKREVKEHTSRMRETEQVKDLFSKAMRRR
eukprot:TRINITY_DN2366_c0_g1_i1.p2 TRINITY_DN2366_c0_g1~~TRINITY_DN2366_c0_g1_i1.p2  ORF type:complete len:232 (+),score=95.17 TRINITY_DN2366_c0_g1_i1:691-1386(+)